MRRISNRQRIRDLMTDGKERTRVQIERESGVKCSPESTLRLLRFMRDDGYEIEKRLDGEIPGLWRYRAVKREPGGVEFVVPPGTTVREMITEADKNRRIAELEREVERLRFKASCYNCQQETGEGPTTCNMCNTFRFTRTYEKYRRAQ